MSIGDTDNGLLSQAGTRTLGSEPPVAITVCIRSGNSTVRYLPCPDSVPVGDATAPMWTPFIQMNTCLSDRSLGNLHPLDR